MRETLLDLMAPYDCICCGREEALICAWCWPDIFEPASDPQAVVPHLTSVWVGTTYSGRAKELVRCMKIDARRQACTLIAKAMSEAAPHYNNMCVTSVPTAVNRIRERGFDHGRLIAQKFAVLRSLSYQQLLVRHGNTKQAGSSKVIRAQQAKNIYQVKSVKLPKKVLIIDDVKTTGATLSEVATVLHKAGVSQVHALVFAQAV